MSASKSVDHSSSPGTKRRASLGTAGTTTPARRTYAHGSAKSPSAAAVASSPVHSAGKGPSTPSHAKPWADDSNASHSLSSPSLSPAKAKAKSSGTVRIAPPPGKRRGSGGGAEDSQRGSEALAPAAASSPSKSLGHDGGEGNELGSGDRKPRPSPLSAPSSSSSRGLRVGSLGGGEVVAPYSEGDDGPTPLDRHLELHTARATSLSTDRASTEAGTPSKEPSRGSASLSRTHAATSVKPSTAALPPSSSSSPSSARGPLEAALTQALLLRFQNVLEKQEHVLQRVDAAVAANPAASRIAASAAGSRSGSGHPLPPASTLAPHSVGGASNPLNTSVHSTGPRTAERSEASSAYSHSPIPGAGLLPTASPTPRTVVSARLMSPEEIRSLSRLASPQRQSGTHSTAAAAAAGTSRLVGSASTSPLPAPMPAPLSSLPGSGASTPPPPPLPDSPSRSGYGGAENSFSQVSSAVKEESGVIYLRPDLDKVRASAGGPAGSARGHGIGSGGGGGTLGQPLGSGRAPNTSARSEAGIPSQRGGFDDSTGDVLAYLGTQPDRFDPPSARRGTLRPASGDPPATDTEGAGTSHHEGETSAERRHGNSHSSGGGGGGLFSSGGSTPDSLAVTRSALIMIPAPATVVTKHSGGRRRHDTPPPPPPPPVARPGQGQSEGPSLDSNPLQPENSFTQDELLSEARSTENSHTIPMTSPTRPRPGNAGTSKEGAETRATPQPPQVSRRGNPTLGEGAGVEDDDNAPPFNSLPVWSSLGSPGGSAVNGALSGGHPGIAPSHNSHHNPNTTTSAGDSSDTTQNGLASSLLTNSVLATHNSLHYLRTSSPGSVSVSPLSRPMSVWAESPAQLGVNPSGSVPAGWLSPGTPGAIGTSPVGAHWLSASTDGTVPPPQQQQPTPPQQHVQQAQRLRVTHALRSPSRSLSGEREGSGGASPGNGGYANTRHPSVAGLAGTTTSSGSTTTTTTATGGGAGGGGGRTSTGTAFVSPSLSPSPSPLATSHDRPLVVVSPLSTSHTPVTLTSPSTPMGGSQHQQPPPSSQPQGSLSSLGGSALAVSSASGTRTSSLPQPHQSVSGRAGSRPHSPPYAALFQSLSKNSPSPPGQGGGGSTGAPRDASAGAVAPQPLSTLSPASSAGGFRSIADSRSPVRKDSMRSGSNMTTTVVPSTLTHRSSLSSLSDVTPTKRPSSSSMVGTGSVSGGAAASSLGLHSPGPRRTFPAEEGDYDDDVNVSSPSLSMRGTTQSRSRASPPPLSHQTLTTPTLQDSRMEEGSDASPNCGSDRELSASSSSSPFSTSGGGAVNATGPVLHEAAPAPWADARDDIVTGASTERKEATAATSTPPPSEARRVPPMRTMRRPPTVPLTPPVDLSPMARHRRAKSIEMGETQADDLDGTSYTGSPRDGKDTAAARAETARREAYWSNYEVMHQLEHLPPDLRDLNPFRKDAALDDATKGLSEVPAVAAPSSSHLRHSSGGRPSHAMERGLDDPDRDFNGDDSNSNNSSDYEFIEEELFLSEEDDEEYYRRRRELEGTPSSSASGDGRDARDADAAGTTGWPPASNASAVIVVSHTTNGLRLAPGRRRRGQVTRLPNPVRQQVLSRRGVTGTRTGSAHSSGATTTTTAAEEEEGEAHLAAVAGYPVATAGGVPVGSGGRWPESEEEEGDWDLTARMAALAHFQRQNQEALLMDADGDREGDVGGRGASLPQEEAEVGGDDTYGGLNQTARRGRRRGSLGGGGGASGGGHAGLPPRTLLSEPRGPSEVIEIIEVPDGASVLAAVAASSARASQTLPPPPQLSSSSVANGTTSGADGRTPSQLSGSSFHETGGAIVTDVYSPLEARLEDPLKDANGRYDLSAGQGGDTTPSTLTEPSPTSPISAALRKEGHASSRLSSSPRRAGSNGSHPSIPPLSIANLLESGDDANTGATVHQPSPSKKTYPPPLTSVKPKDAATSVAGDHVDDEEEYVDEEEERAPRAAVRTPTTAKTPRYRFKHTPRGTGQSSALAKTRHKASLVRADTLFSSGATPPAQGLPASSPSSAMQEAERAAALVNPSPAAGDKPRKRKTAVSPSSLSKKPPRRPIVDVTATPATAAAAARKPKTSSPSPQATSGAPPRRRHSIGADGLASAFTTPSHQSSIHHDTEREGEEERNKGDGNTLSRATITSAAPRRRGSAGDALMPATLPQRVVVPSSQAEEASRSREGSPLKSSSNHHHHHYPHPSHAPNTNASARSSPTHARRRGGTESEAAAAALNGSHSQLLTSSSSPSAGLTTPRHLSLSQNLGNHPSSSNSNLPAGAGVTGVSSPSFLYYQQRLTESKSRTRAIEHTFPSGAIGGAPTSGAKRDTPPGDVLEGTLTLPSLNTTTGSGGGSGAGAHAHTPPSVELASSGAENLIASGVPAGVATAVGPGGGTATATPSPPLPPDAAAESQKAKRGPHPNSAASLTTPADRAARAAAAAGRTNRRRHLFLLVPTTRMQPKLPKSSSGDANAKPSRGGTSGTAKRRTRSAKPDGVHSPRGAANAAGAATTDGGNTSTSLPSTTAAAAGAGYLPTTTVIVPNTARGSSANHSLLTDDRDGDDSSGGTARRSAREAPLMSNRSQTSTGSDGARAHAKASSMNAAARASAGSGGTQGHANDSILTPHSTSDGTNTTAHSTAREHHTVTFVNDAKPQRTSVSPARDVRRRASTGGGGGEDPVANRAGSSVGRRRTILSGRGSTMRDKEEDNEGTRRAASSRLVDRDVHSSRRRGLDAGGSHHPSAASSRPGDEGRSQSVSEVRRRASLGGVNQNIITSTPSARKKPRDRPGTTAAAAAGAFEDPLDRDGSVLRAPSARRQRRASLGSTLVTDPAAAATAANASSGNGREGLSPRRAASAKKKRTAAADGTGKEKRKAASGKAS